MYRFLLALGIISCLIGLFLFCGGLYIGGEDARAPIVRGIMFFAAGLSIVAICDVQRRIVGLRLALEQMERNQARLMDLVVRQGQTIEAFRAESAGRLAEIRASATRPHAVEEPVPAENSINSHPHTPLP
jgi:hypothetical protein